MSDSPLEALDRTPPKVFGGQKGRNNHSRIVYAVPPALDCSRRMLPRALP